MLLSKGSEKDSLKDVEIAFNTGHAWAGATFVIRTFPLSTTSY
jgi:hypothetical protein